MSLPPLLPRRDIVGRRCVTVNCNHNDINGEPLNMGRGVIRASSHADPSVHEEKVLVEFDSSSDWTGRQWVPIHSQFDVFLVEDSLVGVMPDGGAPGTYQPVLTFKTMVDKINYSSTPNSFRLVESLTPGRMLNFVVDTSIVHLKEEDVRQMCDSAATDDWFCARRWLSFQHGQHVLLNWPSRMVNCRVRVYNIASNSQWYSGRIIAANENTKSVTILDDGGTEHVENATLVQMELDTRDFNVTLKASDSNASKPRSRSSTEEHPATKRPKLDAPDTAIDFPLKSPSSTFQRPDRQLAPTPGASPEYNSGTTRPLQVDPGSRNVFSAIMTSQPSQGGGAPVVFAITTSPLPISKSGALGMPATATASIMSASCSPPPNQTDPSKIKTLLGYRPSVMFVIPAQGQTSPGGGTAPANSPPWNCPTTSQIAGSPRSQQSPGELGVMAGHVQQSTVLRLPPGVEYIGTIPLEIRYSSCNSGYVKPEAAKIQGQVTSSASLNGGRMPQMAGIRGSCASESVGNEVRVQGPAGPHVTPGTPSRGQTTLSPVRAQGVGNASGLQQTRNPNGMPGVTRANFVQQLQGQDRMQSLQNRGELRSQGPQTTAGVRMPGVQSATVMQHMQSPSRMAGVQGPRMAGVQRATGMQPMQSQVTMQGMQGATEVQPMQSPSRMAGVQSTSLVHQLQSTCRMAGVQVAIGVQQTQSQVRMPEVQTSCGVQQMQGQGRMPGMQSTTGMQQVQKQVRMPGVQNTSGIQQMQSQRRMPGVQSTSGIQQMQGQRRMPGVQSTTGMQQVHNQVRMPEVQTTSDVQQMQVQRRMPGVQSTTGMQQVHNQVRMPEVQTTSDVQQMQGQGRMPGVQSTTGMQQVHNQVRMPEVQTTSDVQQMQGQGRMPGVQSTTGMQQVHNQVRMPEVQTTSDVQQMQGQGRMPWVQSTTRMQQVQGQVRMPGVQNVGLSQQHPVRMQSSNGNQPYAVRIQGMQGSVGAQQMPGPCRFQGVQGAPENQQSTLQFQGVQGVREIQQTLRNPQGPIGSSTNDTQLTTHLLNSEAGPHGQSTTAKRMPMPVTRFQMTQNQDQTSPLRPVRGQNLRGQSPAASTLRMPGALMIRGMQRPAGQRCQTSALLRDSPRKQADSLRPNDAANSQQNYWNVDLKSQSSSQEIVHQIVEGALRKYGLEMNCRMSPAKSVVSTQSLAVDSSDGLPRNSDLQTARQDGGSAALGRQNSGQHTSTAEPFTSNSIEVSNAGDSEPINSHSNPISTVACDPKYLATNSSASTVSLGSSIPAQGNPAYRARQVSKVSKSHTFYYDSKSESHALSIEIVKGKRNAPQPSKTKANNAKHRAMSQQASTQSPASSDMLLPESKLEILEQGLKGVVAACKPKEMQAAKNVSSTSVKSSFRPAVSLKSIVGARDGVPKMWFEEYEDELQDLSRILDMLKRLDSVKVRQIQGSAENEIPAPKALTSQMNNLITPANMHVPDNQCSTVMASKQKSDCETKVKMLQTQLRELGRKFENPSFALSKKQLNPVSDSTTVVRTCIQDKSCLSLPSLLLKCRECKSVCANPTKLSQVLCRFQAFRRLTLTGKGAYVGSGFSSPTDADGVEISLWMPLLPIVDPQIDVEMAKYIIKNVGNRFCELVEQEKEAMSWISSNGDVAWKRAVNGVREMCDVCNTTLFNVHWVCRKCGYVVCLDCYRTKTHKCTRCHDDVNCATCDRGCLKWAKCSSNRQPHDPKEMMLTQIIPSDVLWVVGRMIHDVRKTWRISENCPCGEDRIVELTEEPSTLEQVNRVTQSDDKVPVTDSKHCEGLCSGLAEAPSVEEDSKEKLKDESGHKTESDIELQSEDKSAIKSNSRTSEGQGPATLREFLLKKNSVFNGVKLERTPVSSYKNLDDVFRRVMRDRPSHAISKTSPHPSPDSSLVTSDVTSTPVGSSPSTPQDVAHVWLDNGRLLQLLEPRNAGNLKKFQDVWRKGQPVMFSNCHQYITKDLWVPGAFAEEFGDMENDLVDCSQKVVLIGHQMHHFWDGFESVKARLRDSDGKPMILKLKDWPPTEDFSEMLPTRFEDLLQGLPLPEYTHRSGVFNLASRLPEFFVRPDLGPKMYNAYGSALHPSVGSTNLHLDVSDAVNLILYVGIPMDDTEDHEAAAIEAMKSAGCCDRTMKRTTELGHKPGALWHIFDAKDSDKIRDLLTKVGLEIGEPVEAHHDPIHDQSWYLDEILRERLLREYSVQGYTIVQCAGDAIFIPAGAPHQVRNLHSCIKAAEDFVSPENLSHCFKMTQEFRHLSDTHSNHEDKLQVKNIIYHAVKDAIAVLQNSAPDTT